MIINGLQRKFKISNWTGNVKSPQVLRFTHGRNLMNLISPDWTMNLRMPMMILATSSYEKNKVDLTSSIHSEDMVLTNAFTKHQARIPATLTCRVHGGSLSAEFSRPPL